MNIMEISFDKLDARAQAMVLAFLASQSYTGVAI
jgi:hypothetical protein